MNEKDQFKESVQFEENGRIPEKLTWRDIEILTHQKVVDMRERGSMITFVLASGWKWHIKKW